MQIVLLSSMQAPDTLIEEVVGALEIQIVLLSSGDGEVVVPLAIARSS